MIRHSQSFVFLPRKLNSIDNYWSKADICFEREIKPIEIVSSEDLNQSTKRRSDNNVSEFSSHISR